MIPVAAGRAGHSARNGGLDAIRLAAALLVFIPHAAYASGLVGLDSPVIGLGTVGVTIFFVLSGYLIPTVWAARPDRSYWLRRAARILPAYWFAVVGLGVLTGTGLSLARLTMTQPIDVPGQANFLGVAWTLRIELVFYALVPFLARLPTWAICAGALGSWLLFVSSPPPPDGLLIQYHLWRFLPGLLLTRIRVPLLPWTAPALGAALIVLAFLRGDFFLEITAGAGLLVAFAVSRPVAIPRWVAYGAAISYGLYLWHQDLLRLLAELHAGPVAIVAGGAILAIGFAATSWHLIEAPANRAAARAPRFGRRRAGKEPVPSGVLS